MFFLMTCGARGARRASEREGGRVSEARGARRLEDLVLPVAAHVERLQEAHVGDGGHIADVIVTHEKVPEVPEAAERVEVVQLVAGYVERPERQQPGNGILLDEAYEMFHESKGVSGIQYVKDLDNSCNGYKGLLDWYEAGL